ncbi:MAG TPA: penicillin-binding protein 2 [Actinomycetota bacterium]|nr:penicillin-binding protein 2 [Actinomycetota bacterium]
MNGQVRKVAAVILVAFLLLLAAPFYWQVLAADRLANDSRNTRVLIKEYAIERGPIVLADRTQVAESVRSRDRNDALEYVRRYPQGPRYGMVTGFYSLVFGRTLVEQKFNSFLLGRAPEQFTQNVTDLLTARSSPGGTLVLTLDRATQQAAESALGGRKGAVVALDPKTGAVLAMTTFPRYDPNDLSSHDPARIRRSWDSLIKDPDAPLLNRAAGGLYPPGSTFKVITAAAALENGVSLSDRIPSPVRLDVPQTSADIGNFGGSSCGGDTITLPEALRISCNTAFAALGVKLGDQKLAAEAEKFGLNEPSPYELPAATSSIPTDQDVPATAQSAIGQRDVRVSPLQMASVAATIANGGRRMAPFVVSEVVSEKGGVVKRFEGEDLGQTIPAGVASDLTDMMRVVVEQGTGTAAQIPGLVVAGKSGTAQHAEGRAPHAWFISFTEQGVRRIAVAVVVEEGGDAAREATGGRVAAPIARRVMEAYVRGGQ